MILVMMFGKVSWGLLMTTFSNYDSGGIWFFYDYFEMHFSISLSLKKIRIYGTHFFKQPDPPFELGKFALLFSLVGFLHDLDHLQTPYSQYSDLVSPLFNVKKAEQIFLGP